MVLRKKINSGAASLHGITQAVIPVKNYFSSLKIQKEETQKKTRNPTLCKSLLFRNLLFVTSSR
jgi:hypothetical protein